MIDEIKLENKIEKDFIFGNDGIQRDITIPQIGRYGENFHKGTPRFNIENV